VGPASAPRSNYTGKVSVLLAYGYHVLSNLSAVDEHEAQAIFDALTVELSQVDAEAKRYVMKAASIRKVMDGLAELWPSVGTDRSTAAQPVETGGLAAGRDYLRLAMAGSGAWYSPGEILQRLDRADISVPSGNPEHTIRRWLRDALAHRVVDRKRRDGRTLEYRWLEQGEVQTQYLLNAEEEESP
jgi:hypothetical protein